MAGAQAGSTGGIGAQSPAVNPPSPMGQAGNAVAGQINNMGASAFGGAQQPMLQTGQFGSQPIPVGNEQIPSQIPNTLRGPMGEMLPDYTNSFPAPPGFARPPMDPRMMGGEGFTPGFGQQQFTPEMMANMQQAYQASQQPQGGMQNPYLQAAQQAQQAYQQQQSPAGLAALLGGNPTPPTSTTQPRPASAMSLNPGRPVRTDQPTPAASKPSIVPPRTPPGVASAIQNLAAKKNPFGRR